MQYIKFIPEFINVTQEAQFSQRDNAKLSIVILGT